MQDTIDFLFCFNDKYCHHFLGQILQIVERTKKPCRFYIITKDYDYVSQECEKFLIACNKKYDNLIDIEVYNFNDYDGDKFSHQVVSHSWISEEAYFRLYATEILPAYVHRIIYLDVDVLIRCDMNELWQKDISDYEIASVEDLDSYLHRKNVHWFTSGFMFMNLDKLREEKFFDRAIEYAKTHKITKEDLTILNKNIDKVLWLSMTWQFCQYKSWVYNEEPIVKDPKMVHFLNSWKPWSNRKVNHRQWHDAYNSYEAEAVKMIGE